MEKICINNRKYDIISPSNLNHYHVIGNWFITARGLVLNQMSINKFMRDQKGFTLLELLLVVAGIAILAGIVIIAINPSKQLGETKNAQRRTDVNAVLNSVYQYAIDNNGNLPSGLDAATLTYQVLGTSASGCDTVCGAVTTVAGCLDLSSDLTPTYIVAIPSDPSLSSSTYTDYYINKNPNGRITVGACDPEQGATISVIR